MSDEEPGESSFEQALRQIAQEITRSFERFQELDVDEMVRSFGMEPETMSRWFDTLGERLRDQATPAGRPAEPAEPATASRHGADPSPLDMPSEEQGLALAALDSGRWTIEPGTSAMSAVGDGPAPSNALGLVRELRVRDWIGADGQLTLAGRRALERWLERN